MNTSFDFYLFSIVLICSSTKSVQCVNNCGCILDKSLHFKALMHRNIRTGSFTSQLWIKKSYFTFIHSTIEKS